MNALEGFVSCCCRVLLKKVSRLYLPSSIWYDFAFIKHYLLFGPNIFLGEGHSFLFCYVFFVHFHSVLSRRDVPLVNK